MRAQRVTILVAALAIAAGLTGCTKVLDGESTATPPKLISQDELNDRVPEDSFFGKEAKTDSSYAEGIGFFCDDELFVEPDADEGADDPLMVTVQQKDGDNDLDSAGQQIAVIASSFADIGQAKTFNTKVLDAIEQCPPDEQIDFKDSVQNLTYLAKPYQHSGWTGTILLSKISIASKTSGKTFDGVQMSVAAMRLNVQVQVNIYGYQPSDVDVALTAVQAKADQLLDALAGGK